MSLESSLRSNSHLVGVDSHYDFKLSFKNKDTYSYTISMNRTLVCCRQFFQLNSCEEVRWWQISLGSDDTVQPCTCNKKNWSPMYSHSVVSFFFPFLMCICLNPERCLWHKPNSHSFSRGKTAVKQYPYCWFLRDLVGFYEEHVSFKYVPMIVTNGI